jgi:autotransporter-associated beta strand protein
VIPNPVIAAGSASLGDPVQSAKLSLSGSVQLEGTAVWNVNSPVLVSGSITEWAPAGLSKSGLGILTLAGENQYSGGTTVTGGTLMLAPGTGRLLVSGSLALNGGVLDLGGNTQEAAGLIVFGGGTLRNGTLRATGLSIAAQSGSVDAAITGGAGLLKSTRAEFSIFIPASFTGGTTVQEGSLILRAGNDSLSVAGALTLAGGVLDLGGNNQATSAPVSIQGGTVQNGTLIATGSPFDVRAGVLKAVLAGTQGLIKSSLETVTLTAGNAYSGPTVVNAGTLLVSGIGSLSANSSLSVFAPGEFKFLPASAGTLTIASLSLDDGSAVGLSWGSSLVATGPAIASGSISINLSGAYISGNRYLIVSGGSASQLSLASYTFGGAASYDYSLVAETDRLSLIPQTPFPMGDLYWLGGRARSKPGQWSSSNWVSNAEASVFTARTPAANITVILSAQGALASNVSGMTLGAETHVAGVLGKSAATASLADDGFTLHVGTLGVVLEVGAGSLSFAPTVALAGNQTWSNSGLGVLSQSGSLLLGGSVLTISGTAPVEFLGQVQGAGGIRLQSQSVLALSPGNTYTGGTTVSSGTLLLRGGANPLPTSGPLLLEGGVLDLGGNHPTTSGTVVLSGGTVRNGTLQPLASSFDARSGVVEAALAGSQSLVKTTGGTVTLSGLNTHSGGTTLAQGQLNLNAGGNASASPLGTGALWITGGTLGNTSGAPVALATQNPQLWNGDFSFNGPSNLSLGQGPVSLGSDRMVTVTTGTLAVLGVVSGGSFGITKAGAGTLLLAAGYTFTGPTQIHGGRLEIGGGAAIGIGTISLTNGAEIAFQLGSTDLFIPNKIIGGTVLTLDPLHNVFWDGGTTQADLKIEDRPGGIVDGGTLYPFRTVQIFNGGTLTVTAGTSMLANKIVLSGSGSGGGGSEVSLPQNQSLLLSGSLSGDGTLSKTGAGVLTLSGTNTFTGGALVREGTLEIVASSALGTGRVELSTGGTLALTAGSAGTVLAIENPISGTGGLLKTGSGLVVVTGTTNTYSGGTEIGAGTLEIRRTGALGFGEVRIGNAGQLAVNVGAGERVTLDNAIAGDGYLVKEAEGVLTIGSKSNTFIGTRLEEGVLEVGYAAALGRSLRLNGGTLSVLGDTKFAVPVTVGGSLAVNPAAGSVTEMTGLLTGNGVLSKAGAGVLRVSGTLDVSGGVLEVVGAESGAVGLVKAGAGTLLWSGTGTVQGRAQVQAGTLEVGGDQVLRDLTKLGSGKLELSGNSKFVGTTLLQAGTVVVGTSSASAFAEVPLLVVGGKDSVGSVLDVSRLAGGLVIGDSTNQTLRGRGSIYGSVEIRAFGVLSPGNSIDVLTAGSIAFGNGSVYEAEYLFAGGTHQSDLQRATTTAGGPGTITLAGGAVRPKAIARLPDFDPHTFPIMTASNGITGAFVGVAQTAAIRAELLYTDGRANDATLLAGTNTLSMKLTRVPYEWLGGSGAARAYGAQLDRSLSTTDASLGVFIDALDLLPTQPLVQLALGAFTPRPLAEVAPLAFARLQDIQKVLGDRASLLGADLAARHRASDVEGPTEPEALWTAWTNAYGSTFSRRADFSAGSPSATSNTFGNLTGIERRFGSAVFGLVGGAGGGQTQMALQSATVSAETWHAGGYSSVPFGSRFFLSAGVLYGQALNTGNRTVPLGPDQVTARSKQESQEWLTQLGVGALLTAPDSSWRVIPTLQVVHAELNLESVLESGLGAMGSQTQKAGHAMSFSRIGLDVAKEIRGGAMPLRFGGNVAWVRQLKSDPLDLEARLQGGPESWSLPGAPVSGDALRLGASIEVDLSDRRKIRVYGEQEFLQGNEILRGGVTFSIGF